MSRSSADRAVPWILERARCLAFEVALLDALTTPPDPFVSVEPCSPVRRTVPGGNPPLASWLRHVDLVQPTAVPAVSAREQPGSHPFLFLVFFLSDSISVLRTVEPAGDELRLEVTSLVPSAHDVRDTGNLLPF